MIKRKDIMPKKCRHRNAWIIAGGLIMWCNDCGAFRNMWHSETGNGVYPVSAWCEPEMSYEAFQKRNDAWKKRMGIDDV